MVAMLRKLIRKFSGKAEPATAAGVALVAEWPLSPAATLGSAVRIKGIERELRAKLPFAVRKAVAVSVGQVTLRMPADQVAVFKDASDKIARTLEGIETLPVLPREVEDILTIAPRERLKWLKDGRLASAGTKTVKMRGRSKKVTFHVFEPQHIEDILNRDLTEIWREEDANAVTENRKRGAGKAALTRAGKGAHKMPKTKQRDRRALDGWDEFEAQGLLR